jgi:plastocyanin
MKFMTRSYGLFLITVLFFVASTICATPAHAANGSAITIQDFAFTPNVISVAVGTTITWTNMDAASHTVTSDSGAFESGTLGKGESFQFTFGALGTFMYHCHIHPSMTAKVVVTAKATTPPPSSGSSSLKRFDKNNDNKLDDTEFFAAVDGWVASQIDDFTFFKLVDLWISQGPITAAGLHADYLQFNGVSLAFAPGKGLSITADGQGIERMRVQIFGLDGRIIIDQSELSNKLVWNLSTLTGTPVANGVYLYRVIVERRDGQRAESAVKKIINLR